LKKNTISRAKHRWSNTQNRQTGKCGGFVVFGKTSKGGSEDERIVSRSSVKKLLGCCEKQTDPEHGTLIHYLTKNSERIKAMPPIRKSSASRSWLDYKAGGSVRQVLSY